MEYPVPLGEHAAEPPPIDSSARGHRRSDVPFRQRERRAPVEVDWPTMVVRHASRDVASLTTRPSEVWKGR